MELVTGHQATPHITAEQVSRLLQGVTTMDDTTVYRLPIGNNCAISVSSLNVSIDTGEIVLHGFHTTFEEGYTVTLDPTIDAAKSRIDKIVMEIIEDLTTGIQTANIEVVQGEESSSPVAPATPVVPTSPTEKFLAVGVIATVTVSNITIASSVDNTELYAGSYISEETFSKTVRNQSSDQYNTTKAYKVGDYVIHNDTLYKCITACSAGSWEANQNCFVTDTLTNAVTTLNSDLNKIVDVTILQDAGITGSGEISLNYPITNYIWVEFYIYSGVARVSPLMIPVDDFVNSNGTYVTSYYDGTIRTWGISYNSSHQTINLALLNGTDSNFNGWNYQVKGIGKRLS